MAEPLLKYHPDLLLCLTQVRHPDRGQCMVGSLTGAVASQRVTEAREGRLKLVGNQLLRPMADRDRTVSRRSKPSSRTSLNGEQPYPWDLLQPQDEMSRHRGAKQRRRCGRLGAISLLSLEYLLSVERRRFHALPSDH